MKYDSIGTWKCILITPEMAELMLSNMIRNRTLNENRVRQYALAMRDGGFELTHQGLAVRNGVLEDGQHRLTAVIRSGVSVLMWVYTYPSNAKDVKHQFDRGVPRTDAHVLKIHGSDISSSDVSWLRVIAYGRRAFEQTPQRDANTILNIAEKYHDALCFVRDCGFRTKRKGFTQAAIAGAFGRALLHIERGVLTRFATVLFDGISDGPHESAAQRLREIAGKWDRGGCREDRLDLYLKACAAIKHFASGNSVKILRASESNEEPFPDTK